MGTAIPLSPADVVDEADKLGVEAAAVWAVCDVESSGGGFLPDKRPKILFEAQVFGRLTGHQWDRSHPNISSAAWDRSLYGAAGAHQYARLAEAIALDRRAALDAASWGMFQILGINDGQCGYGDVESYVAAMEASEAKHLEAFGVFCVNGGLDKYLRARDWTRFALRYNGLGERANGYDTKLAKAYQHRTSGHPMPFLGHADAPTLVGLPA